MERGDSEAIRRELSDIHEKMRDVDVFICDFDEEVIYSTDDEKLKTRLTDSINNRIVAQKLTEALKTGVEPRFDPRKPFEDTVHGQRNLTVMRPDSERKGLLPCHGSSRKVLGGIVVRLNAERNIRPGHCSAKQDDHDCRFPYPPGDSPCLFYG